MRDFFRGWKRKIGVVTLVMAAIAMGVWIRSCSVADTISCESGPACVVHWLTCPTGLLWVRQEYNRTINWTAQWESNPRTAEDPAEFSRSADHEMEWRWTAFGFDFGAARQHEEQSRGRGVQVIRETFWFIPYWSVTIPLTLLSGYLLLSRPRQATLKQTTEPAPTTGA